MERLCGLHCLLPSFSFVVPKETLVGPSMWPRSVLSLPHVGVPNWIWDVRHPSGSALPLCASRRRQRWEWTPRRLDVTAKERATGRQKGQQKLQEWLSPVMAAEASYRRRLPESFVMRRGTTRGKAGGG